MADTETRSTGYGLGEVDVLISVDDVAREAEKLAANAPKRADLEAMVSASMMLPASPPGPRCM